MTTWTSSVLFCSLHRKPVVPVHGKSCEWAFPWFLGGSEFLNTLDHFYFEYKVIPGRSVSITSWCSFCFLVAFRKDPNVSLSTGHLQVVLQPCSELSPQALSASSRRKRPVVFGSKPSLDMVLLEDNTKTQLPLLGDSCSG